MPTTQWDSVAQEDDGALGHQLTARGDNKGLKDVPHQLP